MQQPRRTPPLKQQRNETIMNLSGRCLLRLALLSALTVLSAVSHAQQWTVPTPEELSMTSQPEVPGASAVYLYREESTDDRLHMFSIYTRLKVLTEGGKEFGNVELNFARGSNGAGFNVEAVQGRTIHPDGTIIPFTGKPYEKLIEKTQGIKVMAKVFTMPDVQVGSIIEYRYRLQYDDRFLQSPDWYIQSNLWTRKGHYMWKHIDLGGSTTVTNSRGDSTSTIAWTPILPAGTQVTESRLPGADGQSLIELSVHDIPPAPEEDFMPPINSFTYRVLFYYAAYRTSEEFWKNEGKYQSKSWDKFIGPGPIVKAAVNGITAPTDTPDQKLRKIYAAVMQLENTRFTRQHSSEEEKAQGFKQVQSTDDIWTRKRGTDDQLTELFVAMVRAAGMKAYIGAVTSRERSLFLQGFLSASQLDDLIAIVSIDGKDQYFDPGSRYCPYQHLNWTHTMVAGIRQTDKGTDFFGTPAEPYTFARTQRVANLTMDQQGALSGNITMTYTGFPGLHWRQRALQGDAASLEREIRTSVEQLIPPGIEVKVASISKLEDYEQPLVVKLDVKGGGLGTSTGKRLVIPGDIFETNSKPAFPHEKREIPIYFEYGRAIQDAVRINFPATLKVESLPTAEKTMYQKAALYDLTTESTPTSFTVRRNYVLGAIVFPPSEYANFRTFYSRMENKDQESVILTAAPITASAKPTGN
jgi:hypothetical protein